MNNRDIIAAGGTLIRRPDSRWVLTAWCIPGSANYDQAYVVKGFFTDEQTDVARQLETAYSFLPDMAHLADLTDPVADKLFAPSVCKHCGAKVSMVGRQVYSYDRQELPQYCWVDPAGDSQLHEI